LTPLWEASEAARVVIHGETMVAVRTNPPGRELLHLGPWQQHAVVEGMQKAPSEIQFFSSTRIRASQQPGRLGRRSSGWLP
jgi:hypothetical protein